MSTIKAVVLGDSTEAVIRLLFDHKVAQESNDGALNARSRALTINDLKHQVIAFAKRNPNSDFILEVPEHNVDKVVRLSFSNYDGEQGDEEDTAKYELSINEAFTECSVTQKVKIGRDITIKLIAE